MITITHNIALRNLVLAWLAVVLVVASLRATAALEGSPDAAGLAYGRQWNAMMARSRSEEEACVSALGHGCGLGALKPLIDGLRGAVIMRQLHEVNRAINRSTYREDRRNWGLRDHWAAPRELLDRGGDCEDFAIAKYLALRELGFPAEDLHLLILYDTRRLRAHAVLAVLLGGRELVLDNLGGAILPLSDLPHYRVRYALNESGVRRR